VLLLLDSELLEEMHFVESLLLLPVVLLENLDFERRPLVHHFLGEDDFNEFLFEVFLLGAVGVDQPFNFDRVSGDVGLGTEYLEEVLVHFVHFEL